MSVQLTLADLYRLKVITKEQLVEYVDNRFKEINSRMDTFTLATAVEVVKPNLRRGKLERDVKKSKGKGNKRKRK